MPLQSFSDFNHQVEYARSMLVNASVWYSAKMPPSDPGVKELTQVVSALVGWCEENIPSKGVTPDT